MSVDTTTKHYTNGEITVVWKPGLCIHSGNCVKGLSQVFNPKQKPWITIAGASSKEIVEQVKRCPSGALSSFSNNEQQSETEDTEVTVIEVSKNGPLLVFGDVLVKDADGNEKRQTKVTAFCRCGGSHNKPYCDGTHRKTGFAG